MSEWIPVNLVWSHVPYSVEEVKEGEDFLAWLRAERERLFGPDDDLELAVDEVLDINARVPELTQRDRFHDPDWLTAILAKHSWDTKVIRLARHRHRVGLEWQWQASDPACIARSQRVNAMREAREAQMFRNHAGCRPGVLVEIRHGGRNSLIVLGGECGSEVDNENMPSDGVVLRYRDLLADR